MLEESRLWACWLAATHVQRRCWAVLAHATGRKAWKIPETASLRHRNGAVSFPDMFPCTTPGLGAEWLLVGRMAFGWQSGNARGGSGMRKGQEVPEKQAAAPEVQAPHRAGTFARLNPIPLAAPRPVALVLWRWTFPIRCLQCPVRRPCENTPAWSDSFFKGYCTLLQWTWIKTKEKPGTQLPIPHLRTVTELSFTSPSRPPESPDHGILKVNDQLKIFLETRKHGAGISNKGIFQKKLPILFS